MTHGGVCSHHSLLENSKGGIFIKIGNLEIYGTIYKITNKVNGKVYIGQTIRGFENRYRCKNSSNMSSMEKIYEKHKSMQHYGTYYNYHLMKSIEKHGFSNFEVIELFDVAFSREELNIKEKSWILIYDSFKNGYNNTLGGEGCSIPREFNKRVGIPLSKEHRQNLSKSLKGKVVSVETRRKLSKINKGKNIPIEVSMKISKSLKGRKKPPRTEEHRLNISRNRKGKCTGVSHSNAKQCFIYNIHNELLFYGCIRECGKWLYDNNYSKSVDSARKVVARRYGTNNLYKDLMFSDKEFKEKVAASVK